MRNFLVCFVCPSFRKGSVAASSPLPHPLGAIVVWENDLSATAEVTNRFNRFRLHHATPEQNAGEWSLVSAGEVFQSLLELPPLSTEWECTECTKTQKRGVNDWQKLLRWQYESYVLCVWFSVVSFVLALS